jgi:hypothetical protein
MGCCNYPNPFPTRQGNEPIDYEQCLQTLAAQTDLTSFLNTLCRAVGVPAPGNQNGNGNENGNQPSPGIQCVVVPVRSLCQELNIFHLDSDLLHRAILCTFSSLFSRLGPELYHQVYSHYETFLKTDPGINFATFSRLFLESLRQLYHTYRTFSDGPKEFYSFLTSPVELKNLTGCDGEDLLSNHQYLVTYLTKQKFLEELAEEFTKIEYTLCQKFLRIEIDLVILSTRITELATNTRGGISGITEALRRISIGESNRYFEEDDFKDLFHAAEEVADVIEKLSSLYRERFKIFSELSTTFICSRPQPPVKTIISEIPTVPPTVII